jgi:lipoprotein-anchoring transpeptidase ErfK/SrfK
MRILSFLGRAAIAAAAAAVMTGLATAPASAQLFWDWGGGSMVGGSGREVVSFSPHYTKGQIIVSFGDRRLYYISQPGQALSYPIAIPRDQSRWQGVTSVSDKRVNPSWTPTATMVAENPRLPRWVPGGHPMNPLGVRALYLGSSTYRIHGTDAPWTIGTAVSKGCIRMYNQDVLDLYPRVPVGTKVTVTWDRFTTVASNAASSNPSSGGFFSLFGDDDQPPEKPRRPIRAKNPHSASTE